MSDQVFRLAFHFLEQESKAAARLLESHDSDKVAQFFVNTPASTAAKVLQKMLPEFSASIFSAADSTTAGLWMAELNSKDLATVLRHVEKQKQQQLLGQLNLKKKTACQLLLSYREDMVGAFIETDIFVFVDDMLVDDCIKRLKQRKRREERIILVTDEDKKLIGTLSVPELMRSNKSINVGSLAIPGAEAISGRSLMRSAIRHPLWQSHDFAPVVNRQQELLGILWYRQILQFLSTNSSSSQNTTPDNSPALDILHAHGDSMRALIEVFYKGNL